MGKYHLVCIETLDIVLISFLHYPGCYKGCREYDHGISSLFMGKYYLTCLERKDFVIMYNCIVHGCYKVCREYNNEINSIYMGKILINTCTCSNIQIVYSFIYRPFCPAFPLNQYMLQKPYHNMPA